MSPSILFWTWAGGSLFAASGLGFAAGYFCGLRAPEWNLRRAVKHLAALHTIVVDALDRAQRVTKLLTDLPQARLTTQQTAQIDTRRGSLLTALSSLIQKQEALIAAAAAEPPPPPPTKIEWIDGDSDAATALPDKDTFQANLEMLLEAGGESSFTNSLLVLKIDRIDQLRSRFGIAGSDAFIKQVASLLRNACRSQDLVGRLSIDTFGVLVPLVDIELARRLSQAIRNTFRVHRFHQGEGGPEVLVTASFGCTFCPAGDRPQLALNRAGDALSHSIRRGRNQLHVYDGQSLVHCASA